MGVDVVHALSCDSAIFQGQAHRSSASNAAWRWRGDVVGIAGGAVTHDFGQNRGPARFGMGQGFKDQNP